MLHINPNFAVLEGINGYTETSNGYKNYFHTEGKRFLRDLAKEVGIPEGTYDIRSNKGGMAVSGEVILHSDRLYVKLHESAIRPGLEVLFRSCLSRGDYTGGQNFYASLPLVFNLSTEREELVHRLRRLGGYTE